MNNFVSILGSVPLPPRILTDHLHGYSTTNESPKHSLGRAYIQGSLPSKPVQLRSPPYPSSRSLTAGIWTQNFRNSSLVDISEEDSQSSPYASDDFSGNSQTITAPTSDIGGSDSLLSPVGPPDFATDLRNRLNQALRSPISVRPRYITVHSTYQEDTGTIPPFNLKSQTNKAIKPECHKRPRSLSNSSEDSATSLRGSPDHKKPRNLSRRSTRDENDENDENVCRPAGLRRAASLRPQVTDSSFDCFFEHLKPFPVPDDWIPTATSSPVLQETKLKLKDATNRKQSKTGKVYKVKENPVPVIAPPKGIVWNPPLSDDATALQRLETLLKRERSLRLSDNLVDEFDEKEKDDWEEELGMGQELRREMISWILCVLNDDALRDSASPTHVCRSPSISHFPSPSAEHNCNDLFVELTTSPQIRFHASYIFLRFFSSMSLNQPTLSGETIEMVIRDHAVACLALCVKFHHDFLWPFNPVTADELHALAPHDADLDTIEAAQFDVFQGLRFRLGDTPQAILDELWQGLPSLRKLLQTKGWNKVQRISWQTLLESLIQPDVLQYPLSLLTAGAVSHAIIKTLVEKYENDDWRRSIASRHTKFAAKLAKRRTLRAQEEAECVLLDIQDALDISDKQLQGCLDWIVASC